MSLGAFILFLGLSLCGGLSAVTPLIAEASGGAESLQLSASLYSRFAQETFNTSRIVGTAVGARWQHPVANGLSGLVQAGVQLEAGSGQVFYTDESQPHNLLQLYEASLEWKPWSTASFRAGALNQDWLDVPALLSLQSFPALAEANRFSFAPFYVQVEAEQAVPTANMTTEGPSLQQGRLSSFFIERVSLGFELPDAYGARIDVAHFAFNDLADQAIYQSRFLGNTVSGIGLSHSQFAYAYQGYVWGAEFSAHYLRRVESRLRADFILNPEAPDDRDRGFSLRLQNKITLSHSVTLLPSAALFRLESDATPGYYNCRDWGHSNRTGFLVGMEVSLGQDMVLGGQATFAQAIRTSPYQSDLSYFFFYFRNSYAVL